MKASEIKVTCRDQGRNVAARPNCRSAYDGGGGCGIKPIEFPAVVIYTAKPDPKIKTDGDIVSLEFMPKSFVLD